MGNIQPHHAKAKNSSHSFSSFAQIQLSNLSTGRTRCQLSKCGCQWCSTFSLQWLSLSTTGREVNNVFAKKRKTSANLLKLCRFRRKLWRNQCPLIAQPWHLHVGACICIFRAFWETSTCCCCFKTLYANYCQGVFFFI